MFLDAVLVALGSTLIALGGFILAHELRRLIVGGDVWIWAVAAGAFGVGTGIACMIGI